MGSKKKNISFVSFISQWTFLEIFSSPASDELQCLSCNWAQNNKIIYYLFLDMYNIFCFVLLCVIIYIIFYVTSKSHFVLGNLNIVIFTIDHKDFELYFSWQVTKISGCPNQMYEMKDDKTKSEQYTGTQDAETDLWFSPGFCAQTLFVSELFVTCSWLELWLSRWISYPTSWDLHRLYPLSLFLYPYIPLFISLLLSWPCCVSLSLLINIFN